MNNEESRSGGNTEGKPLAGDIWADVLSSQKEEINGYHIYRRLSESAKDQRIKGILSQIADDELKHYNFWKNYTQVEVKPSKLRVWFYFLISRLLGITFGLKLMENGEVRTQLVYDRLSKFIPGVKDILREEENHEDQLIDSIKEDRLEYIGSIVLGLNDALVELTGALAGFAFAFQNSRLVAVAGLITGIAASLSMAASEYLSTKAEDGGRHPAKAAIYTGVAYLLTVSLLILPFLVLQETLISLGLAVLAAIVVIFIFTYYVSVVKNLSFPRRFAEMVTISLGVAVLTFLIGLLVRIFLGIEI